MRALLLGAFLFGTSGCSVDLCKKGTVFLTYSLQGGASAADTIDVTLTEGTSAPKTVSVIRKTRSSSGSIEVDFGSYPASQSLSFTLTARAGTKTLASSTQTKIAGSSCTALSFTLFQPDISGGDLAGIDGSQGDGGVGPDLLKAVDCTGVDLNCPAHATCGDVGGSAGCVCIAGYQMNNGSCVWGTVPQDPGFANSPMAWNLVQGVTIAPTASGAIDPGWAVFDKPTICGVHVPMVTQTITMPTYATAQPLKFNVSQYADCTQSTGACTGGLNVMMGGAANFFPYVKTASTQTQSLCLGERAYGGTIDLRVLPWDRTFCPNVSAYTEYVDHVDIEPDNTCPVPGTIPNGNFDGTGNWTLSNNGGGLGEPVPIAEIKAGAGTGGSNAVYLQSSTYCDQAILDGTISPPLNSVPNLALQMSVNGTPGDNLQLIIGGQAAGWVTGTGSKQTARFCLTEMHKGQALALRLLLVSAYATNCGASGARTADFTIDDLAFVSDSTCAATSWVSDSSFERTDPGVGYVITAYGGATAGISNSSTQAHTGTHAFTGTVQYSASTSETFALQVPIAVPPPNGTAGPAVTFWYTLPSASNYFTATVDGMINSWGGTFPQQLSATATYTKKTVCIDPLLVGHNTFLEIQGYADNASFTTAETLFLDDISTGTDPSCLAQ